MKKTIFKKVAFLLVASLLVFGCAEDFLEETNPIQLSTGSFWKNINDLNTGLNSVYNALKDGNVLRKSDELNRSDMTFPGWGRPNTTNVYWLQDFNNASGAPNAKWAACYKGVFRANQVLEAAERLYPDFTGEAREEIDIIIAQARGLRGLFYFYLHSGFNNGAVPIFDYVPKTEDEFYQSIQDANVVEEFYRADLEFAGEALSDIVWKTGNEGRFTWGAAAALLGKSYLYEGNHTAAAAYFKLIIDEGPYSLTPDIGSNFTTRDEFNEESILEIGYSLNFKNDLPSPWGEDNNANGHNFAFSPVGGWRSVYPSLWLNIAYKNDPLDMQDPRNTVTRIKRQANGLPELYEEGEVDEEGVVHSEGEVKMETGPRIYSLRTSASVALVDDLDTEYYLVPTAQATFFNNAEHSYWRKFTNWDITENEKDISATIPRSGVNVRLIRLADVYLMYAESLIAGGTNDGGVEEALIYINRVRRRSGVRLLGMTGTGEYPVNDHDDISYNANSLMEHLMYVERPLELSAEGNAIRTLDLRRWGITQARFQELSEKEYYRDHYQFEDKNGKVGTRWSSIVRTEPTIHDEGLPWDKWTEFKEAASNYNEDAHAYWPIPNSEEIANPKLRGSE